MLSPGNDLVTRINELAQRPRPIVPLRARAREQVGASVGGWPTWADYWPLRECPLAYDLYGWLD